MGINNLLAQLAIMVLVWGVIGGIIGLLRRRKTGRFHEQEEDKYPRNSGTWGGG